MSTARIFYPHEIILHSDLVLDKAASHHLSTVLRFQLGEKLIIFNGLGGAYLATLKAVNKKLTTVTIEKFLPEERESPLKIHLGQAVSRGERMDYAVQKAVELGASRITPLLTQHCQVALRKERLQNRVEHWKNIAISAAEQCGRSRVPEVHSIQMFAEFITHKETVGFICTLDHSTQMPAPTESVTQVSVLIGPEGGFSEKEIELAKAQGFLTLNLGPRTLRTETATAAAITLLQHTWGDMAGFF